MRNAAVAAVLLLLAVPTLVILPMSFTDSTVLSLHINGVSLRWYADFLANPRWSQAARTSFEVGGATAVLATGLGGMAAWGIWRAGTPGWLALLMNLPLLVPSVISGLAMFFGAAAVGIAGSFAGLVLGHTVLALPFVVLTLLSALERFDIGLLRAAESLGAGALLALRRVALPLLGPAVGAAALFAFAISFDELVVALFLAGPSQYTLPRQMLAGISDVLTPTICAAAVVVSVVSVLAMAAASALLGRGRQGRKGRQAVLF
jgi:putative spermidine/putrescine transport system permease protein